MEYTEFSNQFLVAAYLEARDKSEGVVRSGDLLDKYEFEVMPLWVHTALEDWRGRGWIGGKGVVGDERSQPIRLTGTGLQFAEVLLQTDRFRPIAKPLPAGVTRLRRGSVYTYEDEVPPDFGGPGDIFLKLDQQGIPAEVPASDRIVRLDDNSAPLAEIRTKLSELKQKLRTGNDLGSMDEEQALAAEEEVEQLEQAFSRSSARAAWLMKMSTETLQWIGKEAAGAVVGSLALAALAVISHFLGFP
jgi:hypothetical protein